MTLDDIRKEISDTDDQLLSLLAKRRKLSQAVASSKMGDQKPVRDQEREQQLLDDLIEKGSRLELAPHYVTRLFHTIIEDSVVLQQQILQQQSNSDLLQYSNQSIAILGGKGAYSYLAAKRYFSGSNNQFDGFTSFSQVLDSVESENHSFGVIPIENTTSGGITEVYDLLLNSELTIVGEVFQPIEHCLLASRSIEISDIQQVLAHPEASRQCRQSLAKLNCEVRLVSSSAEALQIASTEKNKTVVALGGESSAEYFKLKVIKKQMADIPNNSTRFLVVSKKPQVVSPQVSCKTSIIISTGQKPGALAEVLQIFKQARLPLTKLESRPIIGRPWEQMFYIDFEGNIDDPTVTQSLQDVRDICHFSKILGCFPAQEIKPTRVSPTDYYINKKS